MIYNFVIVVLSIEDCVSKLERDVFVLDYFKFENIDLVVGK